MTLPDEFASRNLLLGVLHRGAGHFKESRTFLEAATKAQNVEAQWVLRTAHFELAVLELKIRTSEVAATEKGQVDTDQSKKWDEAFVKASKHLDNAGANVSGIDLGSRVESRIAFVSCPAFRSFVHALIYFDATAIVAR